MRNVAAYYKPVQLIAPQLATATVNGSAVHIAPNEEADAVAIVNVGAIAGAPDTTSLIVTILASATSGGSYDTIATFPAATGATQIGTKAVIINTAKYAYVKATATIAFTNGTTPSIAIGVSLLSLQTVASDNNNGVLS